MSDASEGLQFEVTQEDIDEGSALGLSGAEIVARAIRRQHPNVRHVKFSADYSEVEVEFGDPLD